MDLLGKVCRDFAKRTHDRAVKTASVFAEDLVADGMTAEQIEEMLYSGGFDAVVIAEVLSLLPAKKAKKD